MSDVRRAIVFTPYAKQMEKELVQSLLTADHFPGLIDGQVIDITDNEYRNPDGQYRYAIVARVDGDVWQRATGQAIT